MNPCARLIAVLAAGWLAIWTAGCVRPEDIDHTLVTRYQRQLAQRGPQPRQGREGLGLLQPARGATGPSFPVHPDPATDRPQVYLGLDQAIMRCLANNPEIRTVSFEPAIRRQEAIEAAAAFDSVVFAGASHEKTDVQTASLFDQGLSWNTNYQAGMRQRTITGAQWELSWNLQHLRDTTFLTALDNRYDNRLAMQLTQPLLRNAGPAVNLAQMHVAQINQRADLAAFRQKAEQVVTEVVNSYWGLVQARRDLAIQQKLLDATGTTLQRVQARQELDATSVEINQIKSAYESRLASLIRARKAVWDAQDELVRRLADAQLNLLADFEIIPTTELIQEPVQVEATDRLATALQHNPVLEQVRLAIDRADLAVKVARNQAMPRLDLVMTGSLQGLNRSGDNAVETAWGGDYASYGVGLQFEYPLGNRERRAQLRQTQLRQAQAVSTLQDQADQLAAQLYERARQVAISHQAAQAQQRAVEAAAAQLRALEDLERIRARLTPEFLQVKLGAQEALAGAERAQLGALVEYNQALADLDRVSGTTLISHRVELALPAVLGEAAWPDPAELPVPLRPMTMPANPATQPAPLDLQPIVRQ